MHLPKFCFLLLLQNKRLKDSQPCGMASFYIWRQIRFKDGYVRRLFPQNALSCCAHGSSAGIRHLKVSEAISLDTASAPLNSSRHPHVCVCVLNCVCAPRRGRLRWPTGLRLCLKASSPKEIIKKSAIELLSQISAWWRAKMLRD